MSHGQRLAAEHSVARGASPISCEVGEWGEKELTAIDAVEHDVWSRSLKHNPEVREFSPLSVRAHFLTEGRRLARGRASRVFRSPGSSAGRRTVRQRSREAQESDLRGP